MSWYKKASRPLRYPPELVSLCKQIVEETAKRMYKLKAGETEYITRKEIKSPYNKEPITLDIQISNNSKLPFTAAIDPHPNGINWFFITVNVSRNIDKKNLVYVLAHEILHALDPKQIGYTGEDNSEELARQGKSDEIFQMEEEQDAYSGEVAVEINEKVREALEDQGKKRVENLIYMKRDLEYSLEQLRQPGYTLELPPAEESMRHLWGPLSSWKKAPQIWHKFLTRMYHVVSENLEKVKKEIPEGATAPERTEDKYRENRKNWKNNWTGQTSGGYMGNWGGYAGYGDEDYYDSGEGGNYYLPNYQQNNAYQGYSGGPITPEPNEAPAEEKELEEEIGAAPRSDSEEFDEWYRKYVLLQQKKRQRKSEEAKKRLMDTGKVRGRDPGPGWEYDPVEHVWRKTKTQPSEPIILPPIQQINHSAKEQAADFNPKNLKYLHTDENGDQLGYDNQLKTWIKKDKDGNLWFNDPGTREYKPLKSKKPLLPPIGPEPYELQEKPSNQPNIDEYSDKDIDKYIQRMKRRQGRKRHRGWSNLDFNN